MVARVDLVKASPRLRGKGAEHRMVEHSGAGPKSLLGVGERCVHCDQSIVEAAKRIIAESLSRHGMLRSFDPGWKPAEPQDVDALQALSETGTSGLGPASFHGPQQALGRRSVREHEMFEYL